MTVQTPAVVTLQLCANMFFSVYQVIGTYILNDLYA